MTPERAASYLQSGDQEIQAIAAAYIKLHAAVQNLYYSAAWLADRKCNEVQLWTELRDTAGFGVGKSPLPTSAYAKMIAVRDEQ